MSKRKIYVIGWGGDHYTNWMEGHTVNKMEDADICVLTGGADISSFLYKRRPHPSAYSDFERDQFEVSMFREARHLNKRIIGVCRGAQMGCALAGGILVQDQRDPHAVHPINTHDGRSIQMTSSHHQAMLPWGLPPDEYKVLAWTQGMSPYHRGETDADELVIGKAPDDKEIEIAYFPRIQLLGIQGHPEYMMGRYGRDEDATTTIDYCRDLLDKHMADAL